VKTTLFFSVSVDGFIADQHGIPMFPQSAWEDWCALVNQVGNCIAGRSSVEQLKDQEMSAILNPEHKIVLSSQDIDFTDAGWRLAKSPAAALAMLADAGVEHAIVGGGRAVYHSFLSEGLADEILVDRQPVVFGAGVPIFGGALDMTLLKLIESHPLNDDAIRLRYQVLRGPV
jgi:dihydrofolate reductase